MSPWAGRQEQVDLQVAEEGDPEGGSRVADRVERRDQAIRIPLLW